jgi:membrane protease YdiL (CAAX protease family)
MLLGVLIPAIMAFIMIYGSKNKQLIRDFWDRFSLYKIKPQFLFIVLFLMPLIVFAATAFSLILGKSPKQFMISSEFNVFKGQGLLSLLIMFMAPLFEELGWRGYGVDSLRAYFNLFKTSLIVGFLWALWHLPGFFIKGYYQNELWNTNIVYAINFLISIVPAAILINWVYYKNNRSITIAILFHSMINLFSALFQTEQFTKCIITILLLIVSAYIIVSDKNFFFSKSKDY